MYRVGTAKRRATRGGLWRESTFADLSARSRMRKVSFSLAYFFSGRASAHVDMRQAREELARTMRQNNAAVECGGCENGGWGGNYSVVEWKRLVALKGGLRLYKRMQNKRILNRTFDDSVNLQLFPF